MSNASATPSAASPLAFPLTTSTEALDTTVGLLLNGYILTMVLYGFIFFRECGMYHLSVVKIKLNYFQNRMYITTDTPEIIGYSSWWYVIYPVDCEQD